LAPIEKNGFQVKRFSLRTLIVGGSALVLVTSISPLAFADTATPTSMVSPTDSSQIGIYPKDNQIFIARIKAIEGVGDAIGIQAQDLMKRLGKKGVNNPTIAAAFIAFQTSRTNAITLYNSLTAAAKSTYSSAISPALIRLQAAQSKAKTASGTSMKAANDAFRISTKAPVTAYRTATLPAQTVLRTTLTAANTTLMKVIKAVRGAAPKPTPSPTKTN
jgi:hypothetical protein